MFLVGLTIDYVNEIILRAVDSDNFLGNILYAIFFYVSFEKEFKQSISIILTSYSFGSMWNRPQEILFPLTLDKSMFTISMPEICL